MKKKNKRNLRDLFVYSFPFDERELNEYIEGVKSGLYEKIPIEQTEKEQILLAMKKAAQDREDANKKRKEKIKENGESGNQNGENKPNEQTGNDPIYRWIESFASFTPAPARFDEHYYGKYLNENAPYIKQERPKGLKDLGEAPQNEDNRINKQGTVRKPKNDYNKYVELFDEVEKASLVYAVWGGISITFYEDWIECINFEEVHDNSGTVAAYQKIGKAISAISTNTGKNPLRGEMIKELSSNEAALRPWLCKFDKVSARLKRVEKTYTTASIPRIIKRTGKDCICYYPNYREISTSVLQILDNIYTEIVSLHAKPKVLTLAGNLSRLKLLQSGNDLSLYQDELVDLSCIVNITMGLYTPLPGKTVIETNRGYGGIILDEETIEFYNFWLLVAQDLIDTTVNTWEIIPYKNKVPPSSNRFIIKHRHIGKMSLKCAPTRYLLNIKEIHQHQVWNVDFLVTAVNRVDKGCINQMYVELSTSLRALCIGIDKYSKGNIDIDPNGNLAEGDCLDNPEPLCFAASDAEKMVDTLSRLGFHATLFRNQQGKKLNILRFLYRESLKSKANDIFVLYIASHGFSDDNGNKYVLVYSEKQSLPDVILSINEIRNSLRTHKGIVYVILDVCLQNIDIETNIHKLETECGENAPDNITFLFATTPEGKAIESIKLGGGIATHAILEYLSKLVPHDISEQRNGWNDFEVLFEYVQEKTRTLAKMMYGEEQKPVLFKNKLKTKRKNII